VDPENPIMPVAFGTASLIEHWKRLRHAQTAVALSGVSATGVVGQLNVAPGGLTLQGHGVVSAVGQTAGTPPLRQTVPEVKGLLKSRSHSVCSISVIGSKKDNQSSRSLPRGCGSLPIVCHDDAAVLGRPRRISTSSAVAAPLVDQWTASNP
jgi:hypothetical protein